MFKHYEKKEEGFTLIELLVSMFIISLISGSAIVSFFSGQKQYDVSQASQNFLAKMRQAQTMAIAGKMQGSVMPAGYGLYVTGPSQYKIFYNKVVDSTADSKLYYGSPYYVGIPNNSVDVETVNLPANVTLSGYGFGTVFFVPPDPTTYIYGYNSGSQIFSLTSGNSTKNLIVSYSGVIGSCVASCTGRVCGTDGCGGSCGSCPSGQSCDAYGVCYTPWPWSVICGELYRQGHLSEKIYLANQEHAQKYLDKETLAGYHLWAKPVVVLMAKSKIVTNGVKLLAIPWTSHIAYLMGVEEKDNQLGNFLEKTGVPICRLLGKFLALVRLGDFSASP